ncbi:MAG: hypothetical protein JO249_18390 [Acidobacteria bacterium]|nr:hypothetical protein [Acidobacteriota bacterium]
MPASRRSAIIVATDSQAGQQLLYEVKRLLTRAGFSYEILVRPTQAQVAMATVKYDAVILDATIELPEGSNYAAFTAQPTAMDHILVVSRTPLPLNFYGFRGGGAPIYPNEQNNESILRWLEGQLEQLKTRPTRPTLEKNLLGSVITMMRAMTQVREAPIQGAFVSYTREALPQAHELTRRLQSGDPKLRTGGPIPVTLLESGELALEDELLTMQMRWHLVGLIEKRIKDCSEFWICDSKHYYTSWWTQIELTLLGYHGSGKQDHMPIWRYKPSVQRVDQPTDLVPTISHDQKRRLDRILSYTGQSMRAETIQRTREIGSLHLLERSKFWNDEVFSLGFANDYLLEIAPWVGQKSGESITGQDVEMLMRGDRSKFVAVPLRVIQDALSNHVADFNGYQIRNEPRPRYLWYATRMGKHTAPPGSLDQSLAPLPVFRASTNRT